MAKDTPEVIVTWMEKYSDEDVHTVAYNSGRGPIRVYPKDRVDSRASLGQKEFPYFDDAGQAMKWMKANPGQNCRLDVGAARKLGFDV